MKYRPPMPIDKIRDMIAFAVPVRIIARPERLIIQDYRPTMVMLLAVLGFFVFAGFLIWMLVRFGTAVGGVGIGTMVLLAIVCLAVAVVKGTIREVYVFDRASETYVFVRQYLHRKEVIEGAINQFTGARVETHTHEENQKSYTVALRQEGMFLTGVSEQTLREDIPILNSFSNEADIANAIDDFLHRTR